MPESEGFWDVSSWWIFRGPADPRLSDKLRECRRVASAFGLPWFWADAPCIDQRNSAELSEAITSMYHWYAHSAFCFAYLHDVPPHDNIRAPDSAFRRSAYFRRGWTPQEVIAPTRVVFLASDWSVLGEKTHLADLVEEATGIDKDVLTLRRAVRDVSVARRLSWAAGRETRRVEDEAYCLTGLFDLHLPVIYGEGRKVQHSILSEICDHTLFAWGKADDLQCPETPDLSKRKGDATPAAASLFAPSPAAFSGASRMVPIGIDEFMATMEDAGATPGGNMRLLPRFSPDHHGMVLNADCQLYAVARTPSLPFWRARTGQRHIWRFHYTPLTREDFYTTSVIPVQRCRRTVPPQSCRSRHESSVSI